MSHKLSDNDLLEILSKESSVSLQEVSQTQIHSLLSSPIQHFLKFFNIEIGEYPIRSTILWYIYKLWGKSNISQVSFGKQISDYIPLKSGKLYINKDMFTVSDIQIHLIEKKLSNITKDKSKDFLKHYEFFLKYYNVNSGELEISDDIFYILYSEWCKQKSNYKLTKELFINYTKLFLTFRFNQPNYIFYIDQNYTKLITNKQIKKGLLERETKKVSGQKTKKIKKAT